MYIILLINLINCKKKFEDTKRVVRSRKSMGADVLVE